MRFEVGKRSAFKMKPPGFKCDARIHEQIVDPLPATPFFMAIIGSAGSGKTSMLINLLTSRQAYKKAFHHVHVIMPSHSVASLKNNCFKNHEKMHDELTWGTLDGITAAVKKAAAEGESSLIVMDDVTASLKDNEIQHELKDLIYNRRHYRTSILMLVQSYNAMPLAVRKTLSHFALFKPRNRKEYGAIFDELIFMEREEADALMRFVFEGEPFAFLFAETATGKLYRRFDSITTPDAGGPKVSSLEEAKGGCCQAKGGA